MTLAPVRLRAVRFPKARAKVKRLKRKAIYLFDYPRDGRTFCLEIEAASREEAEALVTVPGAVYVGELVETIPWKAAKARPTPQQANERPRYQALARGVAAQYAKVTAAYAALRRDWLKVIERQPEPDGKTHEIRSYPSSHGDGCWAFKCSCGWSRGAFSEAQGRGWLDEHLVEVGAKNLHIEDLRDIDAAIERFLVTMAGPKPRDRATFAASDEALVQETNILAHRIGVDRAAEQLNIDANPELTRLQRLALNERAFERLTADGRLRFETRLDAIKGRMLEAFDRGESPLKVAKELGENLDGYHQGRLRSIARTEMAIASESAIIETYREAGVTKYSVIGDPTTDALCVDLQNGGPYDLDDEENRPPAHPQCFCSCVPELPE